MQKSRARTSGASVVQENCFTAMAKDSVSLQRNEKVTAVSTKVVGFYVSPDPFRKPISLAHKDNSKRLRF